MSTSILSLACRNFRSYRRLALNFSSRFIAFVGRNGAGKTNILEAISLFSSDRGLRKATLSDLNTVGAQSGAWNLELVINKNGYESHLSTSASLGRRVAKIDHVAVNSLSKFEEEIWILWVIPAMDTIFIGQMSDRRSFFDHLVAGYDKQHKRNLKTLTALQKERLHVLFNSKDYQWASAIEQKIAEISIQITHSRVCFVELLQEVFDINSSKFLRPNIGISGEIETIIANNTSDDATREIENRLRQNRFIDSEKQSTSMSANKTSWDVNHPVTRLDASHCSTGEQKAFLISCVLGALRLYKQVRHGTPILLLDDLMVHLDAVRRKDLADELMTMDVQTFLTGTDIELFSDFLGCAQVFSVDNSICSQYFL